MTFLFFDNETTGLPDMKRPAAWEGQPHICQLAAILTDTDGAVKAEINLIVRPDGWSIPLAASDIHGIFHEDAMAYGLSARGVLSIFDRLCGMADTLVAHNIKFDLFMVEREAAGLGNMPINLPNSSFCTMESARDVVQIPPTAKMLAYDIKGYKSPNLQEAYRHFFGKSFEDAHDAIADVRACRDVFFKLRQLEGKAAT